MAKDKKMDDNEMKNGGKRQYLTQYLDAHESGVKYIAKTMVNHCETKQK